MGLVLRGQIWVALGDKEKVVGDLFFLSVGLNVKMSFFFIFCSPDQSPGISFSKS